MAFLLTQRRLAICGLSPIARMAAASIRHSSIRNKNLFPDPDRTTDIRTAEFCRRHDLLLEIQSLNSGAKFTEAKLGLAQVDPDLNAPGLLSTFTETLKCGHFGMLSYTLLPEGKYPTQLAQAAGALRVALKTHPPKQIAIAGDSAGGNLTLALLAHIKSPHPELEPVNLAAPLASAICISPRCSNSTTAASFARNAEKDHINANMMQEFVQAWSPTMEHVWAASNQGDTEFWTSNGGTMAEKILLLAGEDECYLDDICAFADMIGASREDAAEYQRKVHSSSSPGKVNDWQQLITIPRARHVETVLEHGKKSPAEDDMSKALYLWAERHPVN